MTTVLRIHPDGTASALWTDLLPELGLGRMKVRRVSTVEFNGAKQEWEVRWPGERKVRYSHRSRETCLKWERRKLQ